MQTEAIEGREIRKSNSLLRVRDLRKHFPVYRGLMRRQVGSVKAVDGISFDLGVSETLALVGESGCGKTTAGRSILRLIEPDSGVVSFQGESINSLRGAALRRMRRHMQIIFQDPFSSLNPRRTVGEIIGAPLVLHGLCTRSEMEARVKDMLARVGLQPSYTSRYPHEFSGGQRQRIGVARAVALNPQLVVCDEAVSALDVSVQAQIINLLMDLQQELGLSYLFIAHDLSVVRHLSTQIAVMYLGRIVEHAARDQIFAGPYHPYTQALLSAVPHAKPGVRPSRVILPGDVPSPMHPPPGCHFQTRCPVAERRCRVEAPATYTVQPGHTVACHLYAHSQEPVDIVAGRGRGGGEFQDPV